MSTKKKVSRLSTQKRLSEFGPALVNVYENATRALCGIPVRVAAKDFPKFMARQTQLDQIGVSYERYTYTVIKSWLSWCRENNMQVVSVGIFCGKKAWERFLSVHESTVEIKTTGENEWALLVHNELSAAQVYIGSILSGNICTCSGVRTRMGIAATPDDDVRKEAVALLNMLFDCDEKDYNGIIHVLARTRGRTSAANIQGNS